MKGPDVNCDSLVLKYFKDDVYRQKKGCVQAP